MITMKTAALTVVEQRLMQRLKDGWLPIAGLTILEMNTCKAFEKRGEVVFCRTPGGLGWWRLTTSLEREAMLTKKRFARAGLKEVA